jgi:regulator of protease activity HflC (stomatin/prohibitin superfamily)
MVRISLRQEALEVRPQDIITRDNVTLKVNAVIFLRVIDPRQAVVEVSDYIHQPSHFAQNHAALSLGRGGVGRIVGSAGKEQYAPAGHSRLHIAPWGVKVANVEVKQVDLPESVLRAHGQPSRSGARKAVEDHPC